MIWSLLAAASSFRRWTRRATRRPRSRRSSPPTRDDRSHGVPDRLPSANWLPCGGPAASRSKHRRKLARTSSATPRSSTASPAAGRSWCSTHRPSTHPGSCTTCHSWQPIDTPHPSRDGRRDGPRGHHGSRASSSQHGLAPHAPLRWQSHSPRSGAPRHPEDVGIRREEGSRAEGDALARLDHEPGLLDPGGRVAGQVAPARDAGPEGRVGEALEACLQVGVRDDVLVEAQLPAGRITRNSSANACS